LGFHEYDGKTSDLRKESIENELGRLKAYDQILTQLDTALLSPGMYYDFRILQCGIKNEIFNIEDVESYTKNIEEVTSYTKNPMSYANALDVSTYIKRNFSPLEDRLRSIITIENKAPAIFAVAKSNLEDSLAKPLIETAIQIVKGYEEFLEGDLIIALKEVKNDSLMAVFQTANKKAIFELKELETNHHKKIYLIYLLRQSQKNAYKLKILLYSLLYPVNESKHQL
jgi:mRNA-degrading endonuclease RelE of RelBE toxin-antitoxin system